MLNSRKGEKDTPILVHQFVTDFAKAQSRDSIGRFGSGGAGGAAGGGAAGGGMSAAQNKDMNAATDTVVSAYTSTKNPAARADLKSAITSQNKAIDSLKSGDKSAASKHSLSTMKSMMSAANKVTGISRTSAESSAQRYSELMSRAIG